jgi:hypothetical protein
MVLKCAARYLECSESAILLCLAFLLQVVHVLASNKTEKLLPLRAPLPVAHTVVTLPLARVRAHDLRNISEYDRQW